MGTSLLERYRAFAFDLDGVIWLGGKIIPEAPQAIQAIRDAGKPMLFLSNNASYIPFWIVEHLGAGGVKVKEEEILTSASAARAWVKREGLEGKRAFVMGAPPVVEQIADLLDVVPIERGTKVDVVMVSRDPDFTYNRLAAAADAVRDGAVFVASNRDHILPTPTGFDPGTGSVLAAIEAASGRKAISLGKPELPMMQAAAERIGVQGVLMIGDRVDSDVAGAHRIGWGSAVVLTGVTKPGMPLEPEPDHVLRTLDDLLVPR